MYSLCVCIICMYSNPHVEIPLHVECRINSCDTALHSFRHAHAHTRTHAHTHTHTHTHTCTHTHTHVHTHTHTCTHKDTHTCMHTQTCLLLSWIKLHTHMQLATYRQLASSHMELLEYWRSWCSLVLQRTSRRNRNKGICLLNQEFQRMKCFQIHLQLF